MAPAVELSDEEQMRIALDLIEQIRKATDELESFVREKKEESNASLVEQDPGT